MKLQRILGKAAWSNYTTLQLYHKKLLQFAIVKMLYCSTLYGSKLFQIPLVKYHSMAVRQSIMQHFTIVMYNTAH